MCLLVISISSIVETEMATHSSILAWRIPRTGGPGKLQSMGLQRDGLNWVANTYLLWRIICFYFLTWSLCKVMHVAHILFLLDNTCLEGIKAHLLPHRKVLTMKGTLNQPIPGYHELHLEEDNHLSPPLNGNQTRTGSKILLVFINFPIFPEERALLFQISSPLSY